MKLGKKQNELGERDSGVGDRDNRLEQLERRLEQIHPKPPVAEIRPYGIGDEVFGIRDEEGTVALTVVSYPHQQEGFVNVTLEGDPEPRRMPLAGLRHHDKCPKRSLLAYMKQAADGGMKRVEFPLPEPA